MRIPINISRLTDSPYCEGLKDSFLLEEDDAVKQLVYELNNANPSSFLISGYRGVGKTSFVNRVREKLEKKTIFVNVSLAKYDGYKVLLKKVIRQLYISYKELDIADLEESKELESKFSLLYERTFNDVTILKKQLVNTENKSVHDAKLDLKKLAPIVLVLLLGTNAIFDILNSGFLSYSLFVLSIIWACFSSWNISFTKTKSKSDSEEISRKTLYDDEIAEYHLFEILEELKEYNFSVVVAFDELDKINAIATVENIINDLKALLLCGLSNFFVIAGQGLYYQLEKSRYTDDPVLSSLFSKTIHISLLKYSSLKKFCFNLVDDSELKKQKIFNDYFDYLILDAGNVPRRLSNNIREKLVWEDGKAHINVDDSIHKQLDIQSKILATAVKVTESDLPKITPNVVKLDFFIAQIHLWLFKIRGYKSVKFSIDEVVVPSSYNLKEYPEDYISQLNSLCELLFDRMIEEGFLKKEYDKNFNIDYYSWIESGDEDGGDSNQELNVNIDPDNSPDFLNEFIELEQYVRGIFIDLVDGQTWDSPKLSIKQMINKLAEMEVINKTWAKSNKINSIIETRNKVVHGIAMDDKDLNTVQSFRFDIGRLKAELIEDYTFFVTRRYLKDFTVIKENRSGFDFVASNQENAIVFEVKYLQYGRPDSRNINEILNKFTNHLQAFASNAHYVLFFYQPNGRKSYDEFYSKFYDIVSYKLPELKSRFHLYYTSEYRGDASTGRIETYLDQVLKKLSKVDLTIQEMFPGKWLNEYELNDGRKGKENVEIRDGFKYFSNGNHVFNLDSVEIDKENGVLKFRKVGIGQDNREAYNDLRIINENK